MMHELAKEFFRPLIYIFWFAVLSGIGGAATWHYLDTTLEGPTAAAKERIEQVSEADDQRTDRFAAIPEPLRDFVGSLFD